MVRGDYTVQNMDDSKPARRDNSYKSCVITMFIVFLLCVIIILIVWRVNPDSDDRYLPADESRGEKGYIHAQDKKQPPSKPTTELPGAPTTHHTFVTTEPSPVTTEELQITTQQFAKIKAMKPQATTPVPTTHKQNITETSTTQSSTHSTSPLDSTTIHTTLKYGRIQKNHTTSILSTTDQPSFTSTMKDDQISQGVNRYHIIINGTTDSTTMKQDETTTIVIPHYILGVVSESENTYSNQTTPDIPNITTESTVGVENKTVVTDVPLGGITVTEYDSTTVLSEVPSHVTSIIGIVNSTETIRTTHHALVNGSSKTTASVTVETTPKVDYETDEETSEAETATTDSILNATTKSQNVSSNPTTISATTEKTHIPLVIPLDATSVSTTSDEEVTDTSTSVTEFETTVSSKTVSRVTNSSYLAATQLDEETTTDFVISLTPTDADFSSRTASDDETTTNAHISNIFVAVTESQNTTSNTSTTQPQTVINLVSTAVTDDDTETTTDYLISSVAVTDSQNTTMQSQVVISNSTSIATTHEETTTDDFMSRVSFTQNTTVTAYEETSVPSTVLKTVSMSETTVTKDESTTPIAVQSKSLHTDNETCQTSECKVLASRMLSLMNHSVEPCDNFYEFACGGLRDNHALLQEDPAQDVWNRIAFAIREVNSRSNPIYQKFRHFYDQCVDYEHTVNRSERLKLARKMVSEVDKMYNNLQWVQVDSNFSLTDILVKLFLVNSAPLFDVTVDVNHHDSTKFQLKLTVPRSKSKLQLESLSVSRCKSHIFSENPNNISMTEVYESNYLPCIRNYSEYLNTLEKAVKEMELYSNTSAYNISQDIGAIKFFIEFDVFSLLDEINPWEVRTNTLEKKFTLRTVEELADLYPEVDWQVLFGALLNDAVNKETEVQVYFENYFDKLFGQLKTVLSNETARLIMHNGLLAMLAHDMYVDLVKPRPCNREEYCLRIASKLMEDVSSSLYLSTFTSKELSDKEHELVTLFDQLKNVLNEEMMQAGWLDEESRSSMVDKLHKMKVIADGGRAILNDSNYLRNQLNDQDLNVSNNYFENAMQLQRRYRKLLYYLVTFEAEPTTPEIIWTFFLLPYDIHPISVYQLNTVIIPFGMIGSWKTTDKLPSFVWKTRVGNEIARQIVHHFDTTGILYGPKGKDNDFLQDSPKDLYAEAYEDCEAFLDNWSRTWTNQKNQIYHYTINAARTMYEHFTDNSALWLTHKLFNKTVASEPVLPWLEKNHDELYLLLATQEFCAKAELLAYTVMMFESEQLPPYLRADNMIVNSQVFGHVYNCPVGGKQNPNFKCPPFPQGTDSSQHVSVSGSIPVA